MAGERAQEFAPRLVWWLVRRADQCVVPGLLAVAEFGIGHDKGTLAPHAAHDARADFPRPHWSGNDHSIPCCRAIWLVQEGTGVVPREASR
jgi:hypothetical protein